jgi:hypothetical protein
MRHLLRVVFLTMLPALSWAQSIRTTYVSLGSSNAILMEPMTPSPQSRIAIIYTYPGANNFNHQSGPQLAGRGYRELLLNHYREDGIGYEAMAPAISQAIKYLRGLPGVEKVLLLAHSAGGPLVTFYQNVAENGPRACQGREKIYPCRGDLTGLSKADGLVLLDSHLGEGFIELTYTDPAVSEEKRPLERNSALDMFDPVNGYNRAGKSATYSEIFQKNFFEAQAARNERLIAAALVRLSAIEKAQGQYKSDEPFDVAESCCARPLQPDVRLVSRTRAAHPLLKTDGTTATQIVKSIRPPTGQPDEVGSYRQFTVRQFLASEALRTTKEYKMTEDSITGVDWASSSTSAPSNIEGVTVPLLIMTMSCHYFLVPDEIIFDHAASKDKQLVYVEGASHGFTPCRPEYGDTVKRTFDYLGNWLNDGQRFGKP